MEDRMKLSDEVKVGIFTTIAIVVLLLSTIYISNITFVKRGYSINVIFDSANDLKVRAKVKYGGGVVIGSVSDIKLTPSGKIMTVLNINNDVKIRRDAKISIYTAGMMGEKFVNVVGGTDETGFILPGESVVGIGSGGIDSAFSNLNDVSAEFKEVLMALSKLFKGDLQSSLVSSVKNVNDLSKSVKIMIEENKNSINKSVENFKKSSEDIAKATADLKELVGELNKLVKDISKSNLPQTVDNINKVSLKLDSTISSLESAAKKIDSGEGVVGVLINDKKMAEDLKVLIKDIKDNPWKLLWKK
jgi:phospholipid/cholesterol/gamma-HCH transport system substrate-binding protein